MAEKKEIYDFEEAEARIKNFWEKEKIFKFNPDSKKKIFSIDTPPPTVSGKMHMGHAFQYSQADFIARFRRMKGYELFYPFGTDDNGLPTERLVEKEKKVHAFEMGRDKFIKLVLDTLKKKFRPKYLQDWKNIGVSCDWSLSYSTIDNHSRKISQWSFLDLFKKKRLERRDAPAMWCPECRTGVAQVEVKDKETESTFNNIIFKVKDDKGNKHNVEIATTRPELLPACVAVFYHPDDKRYKHLKGKKAKVPLFDFYVPIIEDKRPDPKKGTGIVMCCTFGDQTDMEWQKAYNLPIKEAINSMGIMTELSGKYSGLSIKEARKKIIHDLKEKNLLTSQEKIKHFVNVHERCNTEIEFIKTKQWFVRYLDLKEKMLKWGSEMNWHPKFMKHRYDNWVKGLQWDWLISNQRYYGVPFPLWYCSKCGEVVLAREEDLPVDPVKNKPPVKKCRKCGEKNFIPEKDILNTWFTSSLTPLIALKLTKDKILKKAFPMDLRPQAHDIITFWLFNTVFKSNVHFGKNPFKEIMISGFITLKGEKMSKSKGNIIEPQDVIKKYSADALRYWAASSKLGEDMDYQEKEVISGKKFINKLFNATRFVFMNLNKELENKKPKKPEELYETDRLLLAKLNNVIEASTKEFERYEYSRCRREVDDFFWKIFTDNYLELVKNRVYNSKKEGKKSAFYTLYNSLLTILKLISPITPFITEEIYQKYYKKFEGDKSIHLSNWPSKFDIALNKSDDEKFSLLLDIISKVRKAKSEAKKSMKAEINLTLEKEKKEKLNGLLNDLSAVTNACEINEGKFKVEFV